MILVLFCLHLSILLKSTCGLVNRLKNGLVRGLRANDFGLVLLNLNIAFFKSAPNEAGISPYFQGWKGLEIDAHILPIKRFSFAKKL